MREPMESRKEQKRQSLLDAAYALFTEKGVAKTSVDEIVRLSLIHIFLRAENFFG